MEKKKWREPKLESLNVSITADACQTGDGPGGGDWCQNGVGNNVCNAGNVADPTCAMGDGV